jgi:hypothetical protein
MHDVIGSEYPKGLEKLFEVLQYFLLLEVALLAYFLVEGAAVAELVEEVEVVDGLEDFDEADDVE